MDELRAYLKLLDFAAAYGLIKCLNSMAMGMVFLGVILPLRKVGGVMKGRGGSFKAGRAGRNLYFMLLLLPAVFAGTSKLFFVMPLGLVTPFIHALAKANFGRFYFAVCAVLTAGFFRRNLRVQRYLKTLPMVTEKTFLREQAARVTAGDRFGCRRRYLERVRVYISEANVSPFSGGILRPYVVMPRRVLEDWGSGRRGLVFCHELIHIGDGHILWLTLFHFLKIYWWMNPMIHLAMTLLREDLELVCDEQCVAYTKVSAAGYGNAMLDMLGLMRDARPEGGLAFMRQDAFRDMSRRMRRLAGAERAEMILRTHKRQSLCFAAAAALVTAAVLLTAYPRYTRMQELVLYDEGLHMVDYDSPALREAARVQEGRLILDEERFRRLIADEGIEGDYVYLSYDTILKIPGCGGGGNVGMISLEDCGDILYLAADCRENRVMVFCLKYLL